MSLSRNRTRWSVVAVAFLAVVGALLLVFRGSAGQARPVAQYAAPAVPTYRLDADHETFATIEDIRASAPAIAVGTVQSHSVVPGVSPGNDGAGDPLPALPHTDYAVKVTDTIKGSPVVGETITVSLTGGATPEGNFVLDGGPLLGDGVSALFFLGPLTDGKYYPLAGGAAVAQEQADGSFLLPVEATGQVALSVTKAELLDTGSGAASGKGGVTTSPDTRAPRMSLAGTRRKQKLGPTIFVLFSCPDEPCAIEAKAKIRLPRVGRLAARTYKLKPVKRQLKAKAKSRVAFALTHSLRAHVRRALRARRTVAAEVTLKASDAARNTTTRKYRIALGL